jgi:hypothetical protein
MPVPKTICRCYQISAKRVQIRIGSIDFHTINELLSSFFLPKDQSTALL